MNFFDTPIILLFNQYSRVSGYFDSTIYFISGNHLVKGALLLLIFWWGWFKTSEQQAQVRTHLISTILGCFIAMTLARALALLLPFKIRPMHDESLNFLLPYSVPQRALEGWSSFPSDHAALFYCLSAGMFYISKKVGVFAFIYTTLLIGLPRIYLGLHYPTDILGGMLIGITAASLGKLRLFDKKLSTPILNWSTRKPEIFYPILFLVSYQIADMFNNSRDFISFITWLTASLD